ncbi:MAG TPA: M28 family peptidase [Candidatus Eremiobacteraeota bacterium]|nr:MAG: Peptidase family M28 [bacterium ADurb.Bin363]HPZ09302.1 M28 family peptidase [Candidatus Eremiobacteraeota bacterium]
MINLKENLRKHVNILCNEIGPRPYWGTNIKKASEYIKSVLSSYPCEIIEEEISLPYMKTHECSLKVTFPVKEDIPCLPWAGFFPYFPASQEGKGEKIDLIAFASRKDPSIYAGKALLLNIKPDSAVGWDILGIEKYSPSVIILADTMAEDFNHLKYGSSSLLIDILVMPLFKNYIPKILISRKEGDYLKTLLAKEERVFIDYSCFTSEEITKTINIEARLSEKTDILLWSHYDTAWECPLCPGANDNTSSVSVALELISFLQQSELFKRLRVCFAGAEECSSFSGLAYFIDTEDFMKDSLSRMAIMLMAMRVHQRIIPVVKPLINSKYFQKLIKYKRIKDVKACLELECLGWGKAFYLLTPQKSLFAKYYREIRAKTPRPLILVPQSLGLETHWLNLYRDASSGVLSGEQQGYPFHTIQDVSSEIDLNMMEEAIFLIKELLVKIL